MQHDPALSAEDIQEGTSPCTIKALVIVYYGYQKRHNCSLWLLIAIIMENTVLS